MKKIILILLSIILSIILLSVLFSACGNNDDYDYGLNDEATSETFADDVNANDEQSYNQLTEVPSGFIGIYSVDDLINSGNNEYGNYILMADLDLSEIEDWESISNRGEFNGNCHTISNLKSTQGGLFKHCENVENLILKDVNINYNEDNGDDRSAYIGAIGNSNCGIVINCKADGSITCVLSGKNADKSSGEADNSEASVGGIIGHVYVDENKKDILISNCVNDIVINAKNNAKDGSMMVGGIVGSASEELKVTECENNSAISVSQKYSNDAEISLSYLGINGTGGIAGYAHYGSVSLTKCINRGNVKSDCSTGGIIGTLAMDVSSTMIDSCNNFGTITTTSLCENAASGGIVGACNINNDNESIADQIVTSCYNLGKIGNDDVYCGHIAGRLHDGMTISYCQYYNNGQKINITGTGEMYADNNEITLNEAKDIFPNEKF